MLALLLVFSPAGIFLLWKFGRQMRKVKSVLTVISVLWLALLVFLFTRNLRTVEPPVDAPDGQPAEMTVSGLPPEEFETSDTAVQIVDVYAGSDIVGRRAFLAIPAEVAQTFTGKDLAIIADTYVAGKDYSWFTVVIDDDSGEGYMFTANVTDTAVFGTLNDDGTVAVPSVILRRAGNDYEPE